MRSQESEGEIGNQESGVRSQELGVQGLESEVRSQKFRVWSLTVGSKREESK